jgi:hypothetical protein
MGAQLNHTIVWSSDQTKSARFLAEMLGRPAPLRFGHFDVVELDNGVSLDFANAEGPIRPQHYAFLISEADFDAVLGRIRERGWTIGPTRREIAPARSITSVAGAGSTFPTPTATI